jgi:CBS domain-containing protein
MTTEPLTARADATIGEFVDATVRDGRDAAYPVTDDDHVLGLVPFRRLAQVPRREWSVRTVRDYMTPLEDVPVVRPDDDVVAAVGELADGDVGGGLVLDGETLVGVLSVADLTRVLEAGTRRDR